MIRSSYSSKGSELYVRAQTGIAGDDVSSVDCQNVIYRIESCFEVSRSRLSKSLQSKSLNKGIILNGLYCFMHSHKTTYFFLE